MTYSMDLDPTSAHTVKIKLFRNVSNTPELRQQLMNGTLPCCMIKPNLILDPFQIVIATNKVVTSEKLKTRTIYTEILFNLSVSKNISQSLQTFGISDDDKDILVVMVENNHKANNKEIFKNINGEETDLNVLKDIVNIESVKKVYKISDTEAETTELLDSIISRIAAKDCIL